MSEEVFRDVRSVEFLFWEMKEERLDHWRRRGGFDMFINRIQSNRMIISICIEYDIL